MRLHFSLLWLLSSLLLSASALTQPAKRTYDTHIYYVLEHDSQADGAPLDIILQELRVEMVEQVGALKDHWLVKREKSFEELTKRDISENDPVLARYNEIRELRDGDLQLRSGALGSSIKSLSLQTLRQRVKRAPPPLAPAPVYASEAVAQRFDIGDPLFSKQWHLVNDDFPEHMMNVTGVWEMGFKGKGVISSLIDDGLDYTSEDLADNFDAANSHDYNDHAELPTPKLFDDTHGTRCAGQIAAVRNGVCGVGIAYESKVAGVRILSGFISDADEAAALNYGYQDVSIYSCSWGPPDDGRTMEGPDHLINKAMLEGINNGRGGKGSVFVFASGNGAASGDQCNFDGYTNSIWSVTVSAVDHQGLHPYYSESCAANMIVAYSSGSGKSITSTDKGKDKCTSSHGGTSAAAPNAVGVFALALEARSDLTWRDIQHLCVETARTDSLDDPEWEKTAAGRLYSYKYGYGALDGYRFVNAALNWQLVKPQVWYKSHTVQLGGGQMTEDKNFTDGIPITEPGVTSVITVTKDTLLAHNFEKLEQINVKVWIQHEKRGDVEIELISPNGIKSMLAGQRTGDIANTGFPGWVFMTVKHWGEDPVGDWTIRVWDAVNENFNGNFLGWNIMFWGSAIDAAKAMKYELPLDDKVFPPPEETPSALLPSPSTTRIYTKPTAYLGEPSGNPPSPGLGKLVSEQKWFFGIIGFVVVAAIGVGIFFWRRSAQRKAYTSLAGDVPMGSMERGRFSENRELYDAFGETDGDEDEDAVEKPLLRRSHDDPRRTDSSGPYRDEPDGPSHMAEPSGSSDSSGSGDGSWVHTS
ncbi:kex protein [Moniliophthora roreri MCA 2997]|uniref:Kex protein n=2 Tax=Moniliophthora roreri TaxID=221103 RepID=V2WSF5_MONRO|nr:kex protein [Moniliophthora roreri MCA 2997]KAI3619363.1 kex protein [Moniliophthora roreri]